MADIELVGTRIPRWTFPGTVPASGFGELGKLLGTESLAVLHDLAPERLAVVLLAAHLKVLAELSADRAVLTSYRPPGSTTAQRCQATVADGSWRELLAAAELASLDSRPADGTVETMLDLSSPGSEGGLIDDRLTLRVSYTVGALRLRYRRDVATEDFAQRVAGYYCTALALMATGLDTPHHVQSLVSEPELHRHLHQLAGRRVPDTGRLFVELFEDQVSSRPEAVAAVHNGQRWSYSRVNERANQLAHLLLRNGLTTEDVVAVCLQRNLDWLAATLGVLKAGGVYLPVRPDFPPDLVATQLDKSHCRFGLTEPGSAATLQAAMARAASERPILCIEDGYRHDVARVNPGVRLDLGQLAYIYFTSGSTGVPKGVMCEHGGMLNHLYAKVDDLGLRPGDVVTQTASQCFDISLWQLAAPLLVGGCTQIVDTFCQLDVPSFISKVAAGGIQVIQVVPAYLDALISYLERHPVQLADLRSLSVTGEALKTSLARRWLALYPEISLVNAYGATEVSDDTMHAVLRGQLDRDFPIVVVGRPLRNVNVYVLNDRLQVAPLGAPGEIAFSGVCVGRGYVNDPDGTAKAFIKDPYRPGTRLYRTGDYGRWLPEGTIEFLGRKDQQVKIRGFRIEIGQIENSLLQMPGVDETAVVINGLSDQTKTLVAFITGSDALQSADLRDFLASALPDYMVPSYFHRLDALPLTDNGKVDRRQLVKLADELSHDVAAYEPPATPTERRLATAWAEILNTMVGRISRGDDFFKLGGTSLAAVRLVIKLDRLISLRELGTYPVLRDQAALLDAVTAPVAAAPGTLLQRLSAAGDKRGAISLICFPYAAGNAVNFEALAKELEPAQVTVYGVELPGHDLARAEEPLAEVAEIARRVHAEITASVPGQVLIWGHGAGAAAAVELARLLEQNGSAPSRVFIGAQALDHPAALRQQIRAVSALSNQEVTALLREDSAYIELDLLKSERAALVGTAYRHDICSANHYLAASQESARQRLYTPVEVVVAADDPATAERGGRHLGWQRLAETVQVHRLDDGGHYFVRSRPMALAELIGVGPHRTAELV